MDLESERKLLDEIRQGNKEAFRTLVNPLIPGSFRSALAILKSRHLAEEAVQNSLVDMYSSIMQGKDIQHVGRWFSRVIVNRSIDITRKEHNHKNNQDIAELDIQDMSVSPLEDIVKKEQSQRLVKSVMSLDLQHRVVVGLYYFQEFKIEEIAALLQIKEGTVKSRLYHARLKLSQMLHVSHPQEKEVQI
ncbi:RNA polymerase sigma factor [Paenibacillus validus]|uniref:RNA polymerase sigma factor n=1 Tax=Paenibacillus validus TaxID=44253 RepID=UPI000FD744DC|nr:RNA polymerase sigma factor [Paenibacillus validus]MED4600614.1 RNA polymerase sigma factor [Paenibacillus validus]MED4606247.1 RNA polymerase sigma factor [Paenibacillus validus]